MNPPGGPAEVRSTRSGGSPCIDSGDPSGTPDADGTPPDMGALPFAHSTLVLGATSLFAPFKGGVMVPDAGLVIALLVVRTDGTRDVSGHLPASLPSGTIAWAQWWIVDAGGPAGHAASNGLTIEVR